MTSPLKAASGWWTVEHPELAELAEHGPPPYREPLETPWVGGGIDFDALDKLEEAETRQVKAPFFQRALELHERVNERGKGYLERARVRDALARYLRDVVHPHEPHNPEYLELARKLAEARPWGVYGVDVMADEDAQLKVDWVQRAGLVKLCPDDAREEGMRAASIYGDRLELLQEAGYEIRYAVFTIPNVPRWHLAAGIDAIFERFKREILYARADGRQAKTTADPRRLFASLKGAVATLEAPLSARGDWNVHLNVLMAFTGRPDYKALREAWGANVEFRVVPTGAAGAAVRELVKYPLKAVSLKSVEKAAARSAAPPLIEWPPDAFGEWLRAHKRFRRTRSWGELYRGKLPARPAQTSPLTIEWLGKITLSPARFHASLPGFDTTQNAWLEAFERDRSAQIDLILGNKSAGRPFPGGTGPPH